MRKEIKLIIRKNPNVKVGDAVKMCDGSSITLLDNNNNNIVKPIKDYYIIMRYPDLTGIDKTLEKICGKVIATDMQLHSAIDTVCDYTFALDAVVQLGNARFGICSEHLKIINKPLVFKEFLESNGFPWMNYIYSCKIENQRWEHAELYKDLNGIKDSDPSGCLNLAFSFKHNRYLSHNVLKTLSMRWKSAVAAAIKDNQTIIFS